MNARLSLHDLGIGYDDARWSARHRPRAFAPASTTCLLGPNGVGKTTLFKTMLGLLPPLRGRILIDGRASPTMRREEIARRIAYVPQAYQGDPATPCSTWW